jgi:tRNA pseudouridine55 synthase
MSSGLILLDKKAGVTSFQALGEIKRALGTGKVGHTGTLDKFASGLLVVLVGGSLKLAPWFSHCDKQYRGRIHFGIETDTLDPEGSVTGEAPLPAREKVEQALSQFTGAIMQEPPAYSAIHINGKRASSLARSGQAPQMKKRPVNIFRLELCSWEPPFAGIFVHCSSGTYIRCLARDIALAAGSRAHLCSLVRTHVAGFTLDMAVSGGVGNGEGDGKAPDVHTPLPINKTVVNLLGLPWFEVAPAEAENIIHGKPLAPVLDGKGLFSQDKPSMETASDFSAAVFSGETLVAVVEKAGGGWKYGCVLNLRN